MTVDRRLSDQPFFYVYDTYLNGLTPGTNRVQLPVQTSMIGGEFVLRRIGGASDVSSRFRFQDSRGLYLMNDYIASPANWLQIPELVYGPADTVQFDLDNIQYGQIVFQGVRRFNKRVNPIPDPPIVYGKTFERAYQYAVDTALTVPALNEPYATRQYFNIEVRNAPFVLRRILIVDTDPSLQGPVGLLLTDANQQNLMNLPVDERFIAYNNDQNVNVWPVPELIYPIGSYIQGFVANTTLTSEVGYTANRQVIFDGAWLISC